MSSSEPASSGSGVLSTTLSGGGDWAGRGDTEPDAVGLPELQAELG